MVLVIEITNIVEYLMTLDCRVHYGNARTYVDATKADNDHNVEVGSIVSILDEMWLLTNNGVIANRPK